MKLDRISAFAFTVCSGLALNSVARATPSLAPCPAGQGSGMMTVSVVTMLVDSAKIASVLPEPLELDPAMAVGEKYPLVLAFGEQADVRIRPQSSPWNYHEFLTFLPNVRRRSDPADGAGPFNHFPRLFLDHARAILAGYYYGLPKRMARFDVSPDHYRIYTDADVSGHPPLLSARFQPEGAYGPATELPNLIPLIPMLGNTLFQERLPHEYLTFQFGGFDVDRIEARSVAASVDISREFLPGVLPGHLSSRGIAREPGGAFQMKVKWCLPKPTVEHDL